jgi:hypothetical protein
LHLLGVQIQENISGKRKGRGELFLCWACYNDFCCYNELIITSFATIMSLL